MSTGPAHHRRLLLRVWARNIHIYISMLGLLAVVFFSVTGIMETPGLVHQIALAYFRKMHAAIFLAIHRDSKFRIR